MWYQNLRTANFTHTCARLILFYLNLPGGCRLAKTTWEVCYWKGLVVQVELYVNTFRICNIFKKRKNIYENLPPKTIAELKLWYYVHVGLIVPYSKSIRQKQLGGAIINNNVSIAYMKMIDPDMDQFEIIEVPTYDLDKFEVSNYELIVK